MRERAYNSLGTSIIYSQMSIPLQLFSVYAISFISKLIIRLILTYLNKDDNIHE